MTSTGIAPTTNAVLRLSMSYDGTTFTGLFEAVAAEFGVVVGGTIADPLNRKMSLGWTGIAGWSLFRTTAMWMVQTAATVN